MSATAIRDKRQTTLPADVSEAAGLKPGDQVEWRFEDGEIRGRKLTPSEPRRVKARLVKRGGALVFEAHGITIDSEAIAQAVEEERESQNELTREVQCDVAVIVSRLIVHRTIQPIRASARTQLVSPASRPQALTR